MLYLINNKTYKRKLKEHVENCCYSEKKNDIPVEVLNASKHSSIAEHFVNNSKCLIIYSHYLLKDIKTCSSVFDLYKLNAIFTLLKKPVLCWQNILTTLFPFYGNTL